MPSSKNTHEFDFITKSIRAPEHQAELANSCCKLNKALPLRSSQISKIDKPGTKHKTTTYNGIILIRVLILYCTHHDSRDDIFYRRELVSGCDYHIHTLDLDVGMGTNISLGGSKCSRL